MYRQMFDGWQHVYHARQLGGPSYLRPIVDEGSMTINAAEATRWIKLWQKVSSEFLSLIHI